MRLVVVMKDGTQKYDQNFVFDTVDEHGEIRSASGRVLGNASKILDEFADYVWLRDVASHVRLGRWILDVESGEVSLINDWSSTEVVQHEVRSLIMEGYLASV